MNKDQLQFQSWGFQLYLPPTPFASQASETEEAEIGRFVMVDDKNDAFYDVDYVTGKLGNTISWRELALHKVKDAAICFPPEQQDMLYKMSFAIGLLVSVEHRDGSFLKVTKLGKVNVKKIPQPYMNWTALQDLRGKELGEEMQVGLLRKVWDRRGGSLTRLGNYVTPSRVLNAMSSPWHRDGEALNNILDNRFAGADAIEPPSLWHVTGLSGDEIETSLARAAAFIDSSSTI